MQYNYKLYIGSDNKTGRVNMKRLTAVLDKYFPGYTIIKASGRWESVNEQSVIVEITTDNYKLIMESIRDLLKQLDQRAIGLGKDPAINFIN
jgi:hypothetical protein